MDHKVRNLFNTVATLIIYFISFMLELWEVSTCVQLISNFLFDILSGAVIGFFLAPFLLIWSFMTPFLPLKKPVTRTTLHK
jgi:hypothetical protein